MIVSIILIIVFVTFAFFAIKTFLDAQERTKIALFVNDFQNDVNSLARSAEGSQEVSYSLSGKIKYVCFADYSKQATTKDDEFFEMQQVFFETENLFFYPVGSAEGIDSKKIEKIDLDKIVLSENPYCIPNINGKTSFIIKKNFGDSLVSVER